MKIEEKTEEIRKAIESGIAKRRIDVKGNGANVLRLLRGKRISEECIAEIYENLRSYQKKPHELKTRREKYRNSYPDVSPKEKVAAIKKAVTSGVAKIKPDPWGAGENGKRHWIYIGKDRNQAEEKIKSWFDKRGISQYEPRS